MVVTPRVTRPGSARQYHFSHSGWMSVYEELVHVNARWCLTGDVATAHPIPLREVAAAWESEVGDRPRRSRCGSCRIAGRSAVGQHGKGDDLRENVVNPERHHMVLRARRALGLADPEGNRRLTRERI